MKRTRKRVHSKSQPKKKKSKSNTVRVAIPTNLAAKLLAVAKDSPLPLPVLPPQMTLYARHIFALSRAATLISMHWDSFGMFLGEKDSASYWRFDKIRHEQINKRFLELTQEIESYAAEIANTHGVSDKDYLTDLPEIEKISEYCPIEQLTDFVRLYLDVMERGAA